VEQIVTLGEVPMGALQGNCVVGGLKGVKELQVVNFVGKLRP